MRGTFHSTVIHTMDFEKQAKFHQEKFEVFDILYIEYFLTHNLNEASMCGIQY